MAQFAVNGNASIEVWIGNTSGTGDFTSDNTLCHTGFDNGVTSCEGEGQYLIFYTPSGDDYFHFGEIYAWNEAELAEGVVSVNVSGMTLTSGTLSDIFGLTGSTDCLEFDENSPT